MGAILFALGNFCFSQNQEIPSANPSDQASLQQLSSDFDSHFGKQASFESTYQRVANVFRETEKDFANIKLENLRQQSEAATTMMLALDFAANTPRPTNTPPARNLPSSRTGSRRTQNNRSAQRVETVKEVEYQATINAINSDLTMRSGQIQQLSQAQQTTVRRRLEAIQDIQKLQQELSIWNQKWPTFLDAYWRFSDPEGIKTDSENEAVAAQLKLASPQNIPAKIVRALVELRLRQHDEALATLNEALANHTIFSPAATAARAVVHAYRNELLESKTDMLSAYKIAPKNPHVLWCRAVQAAMLGDLALAKKDFAQLVSNQNFEIAARRQQVVVASIRLNTSPSSRDAKEALKQAQLVSDLTGTEDWYSELILAMAFYANGNSMDALETAEHAKSLAVDENLERCTTVLNWIKTKEPLDWKLYR